MRTSCSGDIASDMRGEILIMIKFYAPTNCYKLSDLSIVGDTTADLLTRFPTEIAARQPGDLIVFAAGMNDAQCVNGRQIATRGYATGRWVLPNLAPCRSRKP